ncbi:arylamine N-acetyltransferase [Didymella exigua CBS 183.55]|uniref:Arylamine N-acetyltransferase n=1 Tax=Didymella exigua CBS 183.55 TaxID=1150837 RepID=A0A6A5R7X4_9PLEO|nr:arylamine N-acetyltransferase [Didymella exigua CBS 183.55]KAF1923268.1 arylamine N-acetyltransferase [Didymella exigua CBS 183.55]
MASTSVPTSLTQLPLSDEDRPRYSQTQLLDYFTRIQLPQKYLNSPLLAKKLYAATKEHGLPFLHALVRSHTCEVPFENLELHYSAHKTITLDPTDLYTKIVTRQRGGRCMENNTFFATVLRSLGFEVRNCGGRVSRAMSPYPEVRRNQAATYDGWNHMLNIVKLDGQWYVVDVGMGSMGPNMPYPLEDGFETTSIAPRKIRLQLRAISESYGNHSNKLWCYSVCHDPTEDGENVWIPTYCFTETEFLPQDYEIMSWFTSTHPRSFFTKSVTSTKMIMDEAQEKIIGNVTLFEATIRRSIGSEREVMQECVTEDERVHALKDVFHIDLNDEEREGIPAGRRLG